MSRKLSFSVGEYYHIYNRGTEKRDIFLDKADYLRFLVLLYISNNTEAVHISNLREQGEFLKDIINLERKGTLIDIGIYCLMPNHFHLLIREKRNGGISEFMKKISTGYSMYFNKRYERTGRLFEGTFKSVHANNDEYLKYLFAYIHLNPIKLTNPMWKEEGIKDNNKAESFLNEYEFSSYLDYSSNMENNRKRLESKILNKEVFPEYFLEQKDFDGFISDWLLYNNDTNIKVQP